MKGNAWVLHQPLSDFCAVMRAEVIAHEINRCDVVVTRRVQLFKKGDELRRTLA